MTRTEFTIPATLEEADRTAQSLAGLAGGCLPPEKLVGLEIAVAEALSNIVLHGYGQGDGSILVAVTLGEGGATVEIRDRGRQVPADLFDSAGDAAALDPLMESGRGIALIVTLADSLSYVAGADGNRLTLGFGRQGPAE